MSATTFMGQTTTNAGDNQLLAEPGLSLRLNQFVAIFNVEFKKRLFSKTAFLLLFLGIIPTLMVLIVGVKVHDAITERGTPDLNSIAKMREIFAVIYSLFFLTGVVFLGNAMLFTATFRGEILQRSLHYGLLVPVRREILVLGKYAAVLAAALIVLWTGTTICYLAMYAPYGSQKLAIDFTSGVAIAELSTYLGVTLLASMAYGSLFMTTGLIFRSPLISIAIVAGWEAMHFILPPFLKMFSIIHYLKGLIPIPIDEGPMAIIVAPPPHWVSIVGIIGLTIVALSISTYFLKRIEIRYTEE